MLLADLSSFAEIVLGQSVYLGPLLLLLLCGFGLPLPEEVSLIAAGVLLWEGEARYDLMLTACTVGVIGGDTIPYTVGRLWGVNALRYRIVRRLLHPRRFRRFERRFQRHRNWAVFSCRFFPGLRWPGYFAAGAFGMGIGRWLALDLAGALVQVPLALWLGQQFGANVDRLERELDQLHLMLALGLFGALALAFGWRRWVRASRAREDRGEPSWAPDGRSGPPERP
jgi:membrane protein DedA with SNARE-associated domain